MIYGNDLSHHQSKDAVLQLTAKGKAEFVILRTGFGTYSKDNNFARYIENSEAAGLKNSVYHASYAGTVQEAVQEADFCIDLLDETGAVVEMPIFYDYEYFSANYNAGRGIATTPELVQALTLAFCNRVNERGYPAGVYLNKDYWDRFYGDEFFAKNPHLLIWYARPGYSKPDKECYLWQYASNDGKSDFGYNGPIDKNILYGDFIEGEIETMKPLCENPVKLIIGFATAGDIGTLTTYINGLGIDVDVKDGYIITKKAVSRGDQCYIMTEVNKLGNIDCQIYVDPPEVPCECNQLKTKLKEAEMELAAEHEAKVYLQEQLTVANKALAEERKAADVLKTDNAKLTDMLSKIKEIVGG